MSIEKSNKFLWFKDPAEDTTSVHFLLLFIASNKKLLTHVINLFPLNLSSNQIYCCKKKKQLEINVKQPSELPTTRRPFVQFIDLMKANKPLKALIIVERVSLQLLILLFWWKQVPTDCFHSVTPNLYYHQFLL